MPNEFDPIVNNWYHRLDKGKDFFVVAIDEVAGLIEIQSFDVDIEEIEMEEWREMELQTSEPPEDWAGPIDVQNKDDLGYMP